jgi:hypothetical protein
MHTKEYYINILKGPFVLQIDIPTNFLSDNDIIQLISFYKWVVTKQDYVSGWTTLTKSVTGHD